MWFALFCLFVQPALAIDDVTHTGRIDLELHLTNEKGKTEKLSTQDGKLSLSWDSRACELATKDARYPCKLDISQDLTTPSGELLIKAMPKIHFESKAIDQMLMALGVGNKKSVNVIDRSVRESAPTRASGFDLPWYTLQETDSIAPGQPPQFWSAFAGLYLDLPVVAPNALGPSRSFTLRFHFHELKARKGSFDIIGNNGSGNFGN